MQACDACRKNKLSCSLVPSGVRRQKRKVRDESEEGPQLKRLKTVFEGPGARMRSEPTTRDILLEQSEMLGEVWDLLAKQLKEAKEIWRGQEDLRRQVAGLGFAIEDIVDMIGGSGEEVEAEIGGKKGGAVIRGNGEGAEK